MSEFTRKKHLPYQNSFKYFENRDCRFYPCHKGMEHLNCLFCYCPLYHMEDCPGVYTYKQIRDRAVKVCTNCQFPHIEENYPEIIRILTGKPGK